MVTCVVLVAPAASVDGVSKDILQGLAAGAKGLDGSVAIIDHICVSTIGSDGDRTIGSGHAGVY